LVIDPHPGKPAVSLHIPADGEPPRRQYPGPMHQDRIHPRDTTTSPAQLFADLRERNEYTSRVSKMLRAQRQRRIEHVMEAQRRHRIHQAR
jgi:hypothetical protein